jgi:hypothetical protein
MKISYWDCKYADYVEYWDGEESESIFNCSHPKRDGFCDADNMYQPEECDIAELDGEK